ncbi:PAS domain S-box protein [Candidatus Dojkabacteria bacterium]|uniref:histidine kinase n=1 Tax=Candidatus Dojkabacteria bacterium TaxID=2099670 RepID=A0A955RK37_9BACT|nr:PAS domain S-box protein [Candidatus Dojkabacteria bacterium]
MNQKLEEQIKSHFGATDKVPETLTKFIQDIDATYEMYEDNQSSGTDIQAQNLELRQQVAEQDKISLNLKKAIAALEPNSNILNEQVNTSDEATYLTESLIKIIEAHKLSEENLRARTKELESERAKDRAVLFAIGDGLVVTNTAGQIVLVNHAFEQMIGWNQQEVLGKNMHEIIPKEDQIGQIISPEMRLHSRALRDGKKYSTPPDHTYYYTRRDGTKFPVSITVAPMQIDNQIIGAVEVFKDVTREKEIDKAKNEFVSLASHQLRTPLSSINWYTEMLLDDDLEGTEEEYKAYLTEIDVASRRMVDMINSLLNVSRLELGTFAIEPEAVNILDIVKNVVNELRPKILEKQHQIQGEFNQNIPQINSDPRLVSMVFQNLISNAIKYTPEKGTIAVSMTLTKDNNYILASVKDTGYGIPKEEQGKIFTKLFRASNIRKHDTDGNGLGLYIIKLILNNLGGQIWFESKKDEGTTFSFTLPINRQIKAKEGKSLS